MRKKYKVAAHFFNIRDFSTAEIIELTGVKPATARRYRQTGDAPEPVRRLLACAAAGFLVPDEYADKLRFNGDRLELDTGESWTIREMLAWFFNRQLLELRLRQAENRLARLQRIRVIQGKRQALALAPPAAPAEVKELDTPRQFARFWR